MSIDNFLRPKYLAVIGASSQPHKVGRKVFDNLVSNGRLEVFPINLKEKKIAGRKAYTDIALIPVKDKSLVLVIIVIPAKLVEAEVLKCARLGIKNLIIISAGFKESGPFGKKMEEAIQIIAGKYQMNILGPNCLGFINADLSLNATFSNYQASKPKRSSSRVAFLSQSGAIGSAVLDWLSDENISLSYFISLGNKAVLNENDFFDFFRRDQKSDLIIAYLEEISQGGRFLRLVSELNKIKPVAILKSGRTPIGRRMAASHTGSLAASYDITLAALNRLGVIVLDRMDDVYNLMSLAGFKPGQVKDDGSLAIISNAGGLSVMAADEIFKQKTNLAVWSSSTASRLAKILPKFASIKNPLDILGDADPDRYRQSLDLILSDRSVSAALVLLTPQSLTQVKETAEVLVELKKKHPRQIIAACFLGGREVSIGHNILKRESIPSFASLEEAIISLSKFLKYLTERKRIKPFSIPRPASHPPLRSSGLMDYLASFKLLKKYQIATLDPKKLDLKRLADIPYPLALKFVGPDFLHKSDRRAVFLNVKNEEEVKKIVADFSSRKVSADNFIVYQSMAKAGTELILGLKRDPVFGPVILLGLGGIYTEVYQDTVLELLDLDRPRALAMIKKLKIYPILAGHRGQAGVKIPALIDTILKLAKLARDNENISALDINPLLLDEKKSLALDVRIIIE